MKVKVKYHALKPIVKRLFSTKMSIDFWNRNRKNISHRKLPQTSLLFWRKDLAMFKGLWPKFNCEMKIKYHEFFCSFSLSVGKISGIPEPGEENLKRPTKGTSLPKMVWQQFSLFLKGVVYKLKCFIEFKNYPMNIYRTI
jgi:hypothetical protein